jgi:hypothetical protein
LVNVSFTWKWNTVLQSNLYSVYTAHYRNISAKKFSHVYQKLKKTNKCSCRNITPTFAKPQGQMIQAGLWAASDAPSPTFLSHCPSKVPNGVLLPRLHVYCVVQLHVRNSAWYISVFVNEVISNAEVIQHAFTLSSQTYHSFPRRESPGLTKSLRVKSCLFKGYDSWLYNL